MTRPLYQTASVLTGFTPTLGPYITAGLLLIRAQRCRLDFSTWEGGRAGSGLRGGLRSRGLVAAARPGSSSSSLLTLELWSNGGEVSLTEAAGRSVVYCGSASALQDDIRPPVFVSELSFFLKKRNVWMCKLGTEGSLSPLLCAELSLYWAELSRCAGPTTEPRWELCCFSALLSSPLLASNLKMHFAALS